MYRYFKGETDNPFNKEKQEKEHFFWFYESVFESNFTERESSDWNAFFSTYGLEKGFMKLLSNSDYEKLSDKKGVFDLWKEYLFREKLTGMESEYNTTIAQ
jgi:hypothetical protein